VQSIATIDIDDLIKSSNESVSSRVRSIAQRTLDSLDSGITIDRVVLARKSPPMSLLNQFSNVQSAAQNAGKAREDAMLFREQILNNTAGAASDVLVAQINEFERLTEIGDLAGAEETLVLIDRLLIGDEVEIDGVVVSGQSSGLVSEMINQATSNASTRISQAIADYELFEAKQLQFEANPKLMVARDWSEAMATFLNKGFVSTIVLPTGVNAEMLINNDPDIVKELERSARERVAQEAKDKRLDQFLRDVHRTQRGIKDPEQ
jgi:regulator of protease activity HflC (stomatin/prohibitin superfamily)